MKTKKRFFLLAFSALFFGSVHTLNAQVTIGSELEPASGTLLDLKEEADGSATKGFNLPRVALKSLSSLQPCLTTAEEAAAGAKALYKGLQVYNTNTTIGEGVYSWNGARWVLNSLEFLKPSTPISKIMINSETDTPVDTQGNWIGLELGRFTVEESGLYCIVLHPSFRPNATIYPSPIAPFYYSTHFTVFDGNVSLLALPYYGYSNATGLAISGSVVNYLDANKEYVVLVDGGIAISVYHLQVRLIRLS